MTATNGTNISDFEQRIAEAVKARAARMQEELAGFVIQPTGLNHVEGLDAMRGMVAERLEGLGATVRAEPGRARPVWLTIQDGEELSAETVAPPVLVGSRLEGGSGPAILLCGHLDTVHDHRHVPHELRPVEGEPNLARGPGVMDMKGGIVLVLTALEVLHELGQDLRFTAAFNSDEETGSFSSEHVLMAEAARHDVGLIVEPAVADGSLAVERMGSGQFMVEARGVSAHVGRAFESGASAVVALARAMVALADHARPSAGRIVNIGPMHGGKATNAVPHVARCWGNVRFKDEASQASLLADFHQTIDHLNASFSAESDPAARLELHAEFNRPAKPLTPAVEALALRAREVSEALGTPLPFCSTGGVCDGNILHAGGLPTIDTLGVRGGGMHRPDEFIELDSLVARGTMLAILLHRLHQNGFSPA